MKLLAIVIMLAALYLLYRIACPKQADTAKDGSIAEKEEKPARSVIGKSRFVLPDRSKPLQTSATSLRTEKEAEKPYIFAVETEEKPSGIIPKNELDEVFADEPNPEILSIPLDETDDDQTDYEAEEEAEELNRTLGHRAVMAEGVDYDQLQTAVRAVMEQPGEVSEETGGTLLRLENTDMFEMLVSGDEGKMNWIKAVVQRHIQNTMPETESNVSDNTDYGDFVADFLS